MANLTPRFRKGDLVTVYGELIRGWRYLSADEIHAWYAEHHARIKAGLEDPWDSGGEPQLAPREAWVDVPSRSRLIVLRARVRVDLGWRTVSATEVVMPVTGQSFYIDRKFLISL